MKKRKLKKLVERLKIVNGALVDAMDFAGYEVLESSRHAVIFQAKDKDIQGTVRPGRIDTTVPINDKEDA